MPPMPTLQELVDAVRHDAASDDPLDQLRAASAAVAELSEVGDGVLGHYVDRARRSGYSWTEISSRLGVSRQAAHKRFAVATRPPGLDQFTDRVQRCLSAAQPIARDLGHPYIGTEHLLLALFAELRSLAVEVLTAAGIHRADVQEAVLRRTPRGGVTPSGPLPHTPRAAAVLEGTRREAMQLGHGYIGTEHLLLALYADPVKGHAPTDGSSYHSGGGMAAQILGELGMDRESARTRILEKLASYRTGAAPAEGDSRPRADSRP